MGNKTFTEEQVAKKLEKQHEQFVRLLTAANRRAEKAEAEARRLRLIVRQMHDKKRI